MLKGLYKVDMSTADGTRRGVVYCYDDKILGGNSVYGFIGTQRQAEDGEIVVEIATTRHNFDPNFQPLLKADEVTVTLRGRPEGERHRFQGSIAQLPGVAFNVLITPLSEAAAPPVPPFQDGGIKNGLYSIHILMLDGIDGGNTGVVVLHDGKMRGGDAFFGRLRLARQRDVAGCRLVPGRRHADQRLSDLRFGQAHRIEEGAMRRALGPDRYVPAR